MFIEKAVALFFISTISVLLLAQFSTCNVIRETAVTDFSTTENPRVGNTKELAAHTFTAELVPFVFNNYIAYANKTLYSLKNIFEKVIQDAYEYEGIHWKYLQAEVEPFKKFLSDLAKLKSDRYNNAGKYGLLIFNSVEILVKYHTSLIIECRDEVLYIVKLLKIHGLEEFEKNRDIDIGHYEERIKSSAHEIWQKLPAEERGSDEKLDVYSGIHYAKEYLKQVIDNEINKQI